MIAQDQRPDGLPDWVKPDVVLDADNVLEYIYRKGDTEPCGAHWTHRSATTESGWCGGAFYWRDAPGYIPDGPRWQLLSLTPLTVTPSLRCHCNAHGWVEQGRWKPA